MQDYTNFRQRYFERDSQRLSGLKRVLDGMWKTVMQDDFEPSEWRWSKPPKNFEEYVALPQGTSFLWEGSKYDFPLVFIQYERAEDDEFEIVVCDTLDRTLYKHYAKPGRSPLYDPIRKLWLYAEWIAGDGIERMCESIRNANIVPKKQPWYSRVTSWVKSLFTK